MTDPDHVRCLRAQDCRCGNSGHQRKAAGGLEKAAARESIVVRHEDSLPDAPLRGERFVSA
jgi:hypothetical protein